VILTGADIAREVRAGIIEIGEFDPARLEPNSYGFRLAPELVRYETDAIDCYAPPVTVREHIGAEGYVLEPGRFYLGSTMEAMGSARYVATLHASRSVSTLGMWIQFSAPLGHCGSVFPWTLEIAVAQPLRVYPGMLVGKLAFWAMQGEPLQYRGKYTGSTSTVASRLGAEGPAVPRVHGPVALRTRRHGSRPAAPGLTRTGPTDAQGPS